jgi:hypothetical protein
MRARQVSRKRPAPRQAQRAQVDEAEGGNIGLLQAALFCRKKLGSVHGKSSSLQWTDCAAQGPDLSAMMEKGEYNIWYDKPTKFLWHTICRHDPQHTVHSTQHTACSTHSVSLHPVTCAALRKPGVGLTCRPTRYDKPTGRRDRTPIAATTLCNVGAHCGTTRGTASRGR